MTPSLSGARQPTIADVARAAEVSRTTVSHALNGLGKVDPRTRERVKKVALELGYRPNLRAQRLRRGQAQAIALASSMPLAVAGGPSRLGFYMEVAAAAAERALTHGFALVLVPPVESGSGLESVDIDGAIVVEPEEDDPVVARLRERGLPYVVLGGPAAAPEEAPYVDLRGSAVAELLLGHLREQGARYPALITGSGTRHSSVAARAVFERLAAEEGRRLPSAAVPEQGGEQAGYDCCAALLKEHPRIDALCVMVDALAVGAVRAITDSGRSVPDDVLVVTRYDGIRANTCEPPLTAVDLHLDQAAGDAVELLLGRLRGDTTPAVLRAPDPRIVARASSLRVTSRDVSSGGSTSGGAATKGVTP
ncbi:LacI family DNA-binding transcriptional regulator [Streptomyces sp. H10-C2]|uniref:LacI family DNA-binding transcriptional regulator n=1 Tax=unclassified Streptomyces TaxID=2593676 RepID=UPI0024BA67E3|nr:MULTISPECIES: LacI family DNA-binding transcriptional regulator [unclassified Streptomyces]MDJ0345476.1 LacI family DNA-binding transcriptional regulator [Streptomyces sp. PH10-H1]MDJ0371842.1 LacI family DNA-binding transcriptional regulator [Streptomyces sp. H10-C2]